MLPAGLLLSSYECPFVIRCKRRRLHRSKESCKQKRHTAQTFSLSVRVSLSCLLAYYTTLYVLLQFLFPAACAALWRLQRCFIVHLHPSSLLLLPSDPCHKHQCYADDGCHNYHSVVDHVTSFLLPLQRIILQT